MTRKADWQSSFWNQVMKESFGPFVWGERDCVLVSARVCDAVLEDPQMEAAARAFGSWTTAREAANILERLGGLESAISSVLGPSVGKQWLGKGDLVLCSYDDPDQIFNYALAFHDGMSPIVPGDRKLVQVQQSLALCGWRVA